MADMVAFAMLTRLYLQAQPLNRQFCLDVKLQSHSLLLKAAEAQRNFSKMPFFFLVLCAKCANDTVPCRQHS